MFRVLYLQEDLSVCRAFRFVQSITVCCIGFACRIAGCKFHALPAGLPQRSQRRYGARCCIKGQLIRKDQDLRTDAHQRLFIVGHGIRTGHRFCIGGIRSIDQIGPADGQQTVQVIHPIQIGQRPALYSASEQA